LGIGDWAQYPIPQNQNPKPKNQKFNIFLTKFKIKIL